MPIHALNDALDHIHTDAAPSLIADLIGSGETWEEDKFDDLCFRQGFGDFCTDQSPFHSFGLNFPDVETSTVVFHFDDNRVSAMSSMQIDRAGRRFPLRHTSRRRFNSVIDRIPYQVD